jgi:hypothetical protein
MGNGPSLEKMIREKRDFMKGKHLFCVNFFPLSKYYEEVRPDYFITAAPELWLEDLDENYTAKADLLFTALRDKTEWPLEVFMPFQSRKWNNWQDKIRANPHLRLTFFNDTGIEGFRKTEHFFFRKNLGMPRPHNVLIPSILMAINLGYEDIFIWGAENNQFLDLSVNEKNQALINQRHFYDEKTAKPDVMRRLGRGQRYVHEILEKFMISFRSYHTLQSYAKSRGARIFNQTPGSLIDAFPRSTPS